MNLLRAGEVEGEGLRAGEATLITLLLPRPPPPLVPGLVRACRRVFAARCQVMAVPGGGLHEGLTRSLQRLTPGPRGGFLLPARRGRGLALAAGTLVPAGGTVQLLAAGPAAGSHRGPPPPPRAAAAGHAAVAAGGGSHRCGASALPVPSTTRALMLRTDSALLTQRSHRHKQNPAGPRVTKKTVYETQSAAPTLVAAESIAAEDGNLSYSLARHRRSPRQFVSLSARPQHSSPSGRSRLRMTHTGMEVSTSLMEPHRMRAPA